VKGIHYWTKWLPKAFEAHSDRGVKGESRSYVSISRSPYHFHSVSYLQLGICTNVQTKLTNTEQASAAVTNLDRNPEVPDSNTTKKLVI
jgi:hypothetical protein